MGWLKSRMPLQYSLLALRLELERKSLAGVYNLLKNYWTTKTLPASPDNGLTILAMETTLVCNLNCPMCFRDFEDGNKAFLTFENFKHFIHQFPHLRQLNLTGNGEPLLNKDIFEIIGYAKQRLSLYVRLTTNGTVLTDNNITRIIRSGLDELRVSIDGATSGTFRSLREGADLKDVVGKLKNLDRLKKENNSRAPALEINSILLKESVEEFPELVELAREVNARGIFVSGLDYYDGYRYATKEHTVFGMKISKLKKIYDETMKKSRRLKVAVRLPPLKPVPGKCYWPWVTLYVTYQGHVIPCCKFTSGPDREEIIEKFSLGNLLTDDFQSIWNNQKSINFRKNLASNRLPGTCRKCNITTGLM